MASRASEKRGTSMGGNAVVGEGKGGAGSATDGGGIPREAIKAAGVVADDGVGGNWVGLCDADCVVECGWAWRGGRASSGKLSSADGVVVLRMLGVGCRRIGAGAGVGRNGRGELDQYSCSTRTGRWQGGCVHVGVSAPCCVSVRGVPRRAKTGDNDRGRVMAGPLFDSALQRVRADEATTKENEDMQNQTSIIFVSSLSDHWLGGEASWCSS